jgi:hypothetical protein
MLSAVFVAQAESHLAIRGSESWNFFAPGA